jgi:GT2 family glycosyltransferase
VSEPSISVVIPTYRRPERLRRCLEALGRSSGVQGGLELVVVEDGGPTEAVQALAALELGPHTILRLLHQPHAGPATARNRGAREAVGSLLLFTDDDCAPDAGWVAAMQARLVANPGGFVGGHTRNGLPRNPWSAASQELVTFITRWGLERGPLFFASNNYGLHRADFERVGGFDESFPLAGGEDRDFSDRCEQAGLRFVHAPEARIDHFHELGPATFWRQHFAYGRGAYQYRLRRAQRQGAPFRVEMQRTLAATRLGFYLQLVTSPWRSPDAPPRWAAALLLAASQVPNTLGFFHERRLSVRRP